MYSVYGRRFNISKNKIGNNNTINVLGTSYNPYQPKTANQKDLQSFYAVMNSIHKISPTRKKHPYNRPVFNYGNLLRDSMKFKSVSKSNCPESLITNSYNIINNNPKNVKYSFSKYNNDSGRNFLFSNKEKENDTFNYGSRQNNFLRNNNEDKNNNFKYSSNYFSLNKRNFFNDNEHKLNKPPTAPNQPFLNKINSINNNSNNINSNNNSSNSFTEKEIEEKYSNINSTEYFEKPFNLNLIKEYAYKENPNIRFRDYMEDKSRVIENFNKNINNILFCLFDGHGGGEVSKYLQNNFYTHMKSYLPFDEINFENFFKNVFLDIDNKLKELNYYQVGSTACILYITIENNKKFLYCANVGDTRCILIKKNEVKRLSYDDRANDENEYNRIIKEGGVVFDGRVCGQLMLSRAFGDWELKSFGVSCIPHVIKYEINESDKYLIIASDGVWDVVNDYEVFNMDFDGLNCLEICDNIMNRVIDKGSMDNISCFVIKLN